MHICHVNLASGFSGGERQTLTLIQQQAQMGYQLTAVVNPKSPLVDELRAIPQCQIVLCPHYTRQHGRSITATCDLIHVHEGRAIYWALFQHLLHRVPYIVTRRIDNPLKKKWLSQLAYRKASALVGLSSEIIYQLEKRHPSAKLVKIPSSPVTYPVSQDKVEQIKAHFRGKFLVIHAANMYAHKGFDVTIEAARLLADTSPDIQFCLLGDGKERASLEAQAQGITNVHFMGKQTNMGDWFAAADLLIHPSYTEGLGSVILEAMAAGLPVIGARAGGIPDIIEHGATGHLIEPGNANQLAQHIADITQQDALRAHLIAGSQQQAAACDISQTALTYQTLYQQIITELR
ncbi:glycosyltransferase family 4 protein [Salinivibrio kushneri]|uniref:glycosyltransferase family 4 protein n=1 Tax=Salinivibrio kushneri TaxID=1908198 RepID=UPI000988908B|nr:glycosyltransferase family 4 protein [Salinivibrio kushneri]OOE38225.1 glycosyl transferase [Salinivibrio kushneri]OOE55213.1 glycosyl transferase [Salinivibrio kushneri]